MTEKQKMIAGQLYRPDDPELIAGRERARRLAEQLNGLPMAKVDQRTAILRDLLGSAGDKMHLENHFWCDYGYNTYLGENFYANFDGVFLDVASIRIGANAMLGPRVQLHTATHPLIAAGRNSGWEYAKPIIIGDNAWIGGGAIIHPGVTVGDGAVIGSGSVVTRDIPVGVFAAGNPCRVIRKIGEGDRMM
jgi:maltose O-acetyltransferase